MSRRKRVTNFSEPDYLNVADRPLAPGVEVVQLNRDRIRDRFGFEYSENMVAEPEQCFGFRNEVAEIERHQKHWQKLTERMQVMPQRLLVVCHINDEVGYGVFTRLPIKAGTFVCVYSGLQESINSDGSDKFYTMKVPQAQVRVNAASTGGIARFIQHLPFDLKSLCETVRVADEDNLREVVSSHHLVLSDDMTPALNDPTGLENIKEQVIKKFTSIFEDQILTKELDEKPFLSMGPVYQQLAVANLTTFLIIADGQAVMALRADRDIPAYAQLGFSYGLGYWDIKRQVPRYFNRETGSVIPRAVYLPNLAEVCVKYRITSDTGLPDLNASLRRAAHRGEVTDMAILLEYGANIDSQGARTGKTALHQAARAGQREAMRFLINKYASETIRDASGKLACEQAGYVDPWEQEAVTATTATMAT